MIRTDDSSTMTQPTQSAGVTVINAKLSGTWNGKTIDFTCDFDPPWNGNSKGDAKLPKDSGRHQFNFHIDRSGMNLQFVQGQGVLAVDEGSAGCPSQPGINTDQVLPSSVESNGQNAKFIDENEGLGRDLRYALNVTSDHGSGQFDPIIQNGGTK
jgi:hypothetical protein